MHTAETRNLHHATVIIALNAKVNYYPDHIQLLHILFHLITPSASKLRKKNGKRERQNTFNILHDQSTAHRCSRCNALAKKHVRSLCIHV